MSTESVDRAYAERLHQEEASGGMMASHKGKAVLLVADIISLANQTNQNCPSLMNYNIKSVAYDDMTFLAEQMLALQQEFEANNHPTDVDIGHHYTDNQNLPKITTYGLLSKVEKHEKKVSSAKKRGSNFGDGIYTGNNPHAFAHYGDVGLICGRLKGNILHGVIKSLSTSVTVDDNIHCVIGDKCIYGEQEDANGWPIDDHYNEIVLRSRRQVLPMIRYDATLAKTPEGRECIENMETSLQLILDKFFNNDGKPSATAAPSFTFTSPRKKPDPPSSSGNFPSPVFMTASKTRQTGVFGSALSANFFPAIKGSTAVPYRTTTKVVGCNTITFQAITAMPQYECKSLEELRLEDYLAGNKGSGVVRTAPAGSGFNFGTPSAERFAFGAKSDAPVYHSSSSGGFSSSFAPTSNVFTSPFDGQITALAPTTKQWQQTNSGSTAVPYQTTAKFDGSQVLKMQAISAMPQYEQQSFEEL